MHVVFFDIDGTLVLTGGAGKYAFEETLIDEFGITPQEHQIPFAGRSDRAIAFDMFRAYGLPDSVETWQRFRHAYLHRLEMRLESCTGHVLPGVEALIDALLPRDDIVIGLITGNLRPAAQMKLGYYDLWHYFRFGGFGDDFIDRNDIAASAMKEAKSHLASRPDSPHDFAGNVLVIGDTLNDITCARSIGAVAIAVPTGQTSSETLATGSPDLLLDTLEASTPILDLLPPLD